MIRTRNARAVLVILLSAMLMIAFMPQAAFTSYAASTSKVSKITRILPTAKSSYKMTAGTSRTFKVKLYPKNLKSAKKTTYVTSSKTSVATVSGKKYIKKSGYRYVKFKVNAKKAGTATIRAKAKYGGRYASWKVTVKAAPVTAAVPQGIKGVKSGTGTTLGGTTTSFDFTTAIEFTDSNGSVMTTGAPAYSDTHTEGYTYAVYSSSGTALNAADAAKVTEAGTYTVKLYKGAAVIAAKTVEITKLSSDASTYSYSASIVSGDELLYVAAGSTDKARVILKVSDKNGNTVEVPNGQYTAAVDSGLAMVNGASYWYVSGSSSLASGTTDWATVKVSVNGEVVATTTLKYSNATPAAASSKWVNNTDPTAIFGDVVYNSLGTTYVAQDPEGIVHFWNNTRTMDYELSIVDQYGIPMSAAACTVYDSNFKAWKSLGSWTGWIYPGYSDVKLTAGTVSRTITVMDSTTHVSKPTVSVTNDSTHKLTADASGQSVYYQWYKDGSSISGATSATYLPTEKGKYTVRVTGKDGYSGEETSAAFEMYDVSTPTLSEPAADHTMTATVTAAESGNVTYQWYKGGTAIDGATSSTYTPANEAASAGSYTVKITGTGKYFSTAESSARTLTAVASPIISVAVDHTMSASDPNSQTVTYQWSMGGSARANGTTASYKAGEAGTYTVAVSGTGYFVGTATSAGFEIKNIAGTLSIGASGKTLTASMSASQDVSYQWYLGSSEISGATSSSYLTTEAGYYKVMITGTYSYIGTKTSLQYIIAQLPTTAYATGSTLTVNDQYGTNMVSSFAGSDFNVTATTVESGGTPTGTITVSSNGALSASGNGNWGQGGTLVGTKTIMGKVLQITANYSQSEWSYSAQINN